MVLTGVLLRQVGFSQKKTKIIEFFSLTLRNLVILKVVILDCAILRREVLIFLIFFISHGSSYFISLFLNFELSM